MRSTSLAENGTVQLFFISCCYGDYVHTKFHIICISEWKREQTRNRKCQNAWWNSASDKFNCYTKHKYKHFLRKHTKFVDSKSPKNIRKVANNCFQKVSEWVLLHSVISHSKTNYKTKSNRIGEQRKLDVHFLCNK